MTTQFKVISAFKDAQDNQKEYKIGDKYQGATDSKRVQELLAANVITEEVQQEQSNQETVQNAKAQGQTQQAQSQQAKGKKAKEVGE